MLCPSLYNLFVLFVVSPKTGLNVEKSMNALISEIIKGSTYLKRVVVSQIDSHNDRKSVDDTADECNIELKMGTSFWDGYSQPVWSAECLKENSLIPIIPDIGCILSFPLLLLGDPGSGATSFINRYVDDTFDPSQRTTLFSDLKFVNAMTYDGEVRVTFNEFSASEKRYPLGTVPKRTNFGFIVIYDVTKRSSVDAIRQRYMTLWNNAPFAVIMVIGTKTDLEDKREVSVKEGEALARDLHASLFFEGKQKTYNL